MQAGAISLALGVIYSDSDFKGSPELCTAVLRGEPNHSHSTVVASVYLSHADARQRLCGRHLWSLGLLASFTYILASGDARLMAKVRHLQQRHHASYTSKGALRRLALLDGKSLLLLM